MEPGAKSKVPKSISFPLCDKLLIDGHIKKRCQGFSFSDAVVSLCKKGIGSHGEYINYDHVEKVSRVLTVIPRSVRDTSLSLMIPQLSFREREEICKDYESKTALKKMERMLNVSKKN